MREVTPEITTRLARALVVAVSRDETSLAPDAMAALKQDFAAYPLASEAYRNTTPNAIFEARQVEAITNSAVLTTRLIRYVALPAQTKAELLAASDAERSKKLREAMRGTYATGRPLGTPRVPRGVLLVLQC